MNLESSSIVFYWYLIIEGKLHKIQKNKKYAAYKRRTYVKKTSKFRSLSEALRTFISAVAFDISPNRLGFMCTKRIQKVAE